MSENQENTIITEETATETIAAEAAKVEALKDEKPAGEAQPPKKKKKVGLVILFVVLGIIVLLALVLGIAAFTLLRAATTDNLPEAPVVSSGDLKSFAADAAVEVLQEKTITIESGDINLILEQVKESVNNADIPGADFTVNDLFCDIQEGQGKIYARVDIREIEVKGTKIALNKVLPVEIDFGVDFAEPEIVIIPQKITCGKIDIPMDMVNTVLEKVTLPENMRYENGNIFYDTGKLDGMIDEILAAKIQSTINDSDVLGFLGNLLGEDNANSLAEKLTGVVVDAATNTTDVQIYDARIDGDKLILEGQVM